MADNVDITPGAGKTIATDDVAGVHYQRVKIDVGADGAASAVTSTNPLPVAVVSGGGALHTITGALQVTSRDEVTIKSFGTAIPCTRVRVKSIKANAAGALVYVGNSGMSTGVGTVPIGNGYELEPGESVEIAATDVRDVFVATLQGQTAVVCWEATVIGDPEGGHFYSTWQ